MNNLYINMIKYENIKYIFYKVKRSCKNKEAINKFKLNLNINLYRILELLYKREYKFNKYKIFMIKDPKYRIIMSENIQDKIVNHLISKYILLPSLESKFIDTNVATRINRGSSYAYNKFIKYINNLKYQKKEIYVLKIDIKKYFYNIEHNILFNKISKYIKDKDALKIIKDIINSTNEEYVNKNIIDLKNKTIKYISNLNISNNKYDKYYSFI